VADFRISPIKIICDYLWYRLKAEESNLLDPTGSLTGVVTAWDNSVNPFSPVIDSGPKGNNPVWFTWDYIQDFRSGDLFPIKREQGLLSIVSTLENVHWINSVKNFISSELDKIDETAKDINNWAKANNVNTGGITLHWHRTVGQEDYVEDSTNLRTSSIEQTRVRAKIVLEYEYVRS
jgi:hypothetical protein